MILHILLAALLTWLALLIILYGAIYAIAIIGCWRKMSVPAIKASWPYQTIEFVADLLIAPAIGLMLACARFGCFIALRFIEMRIRQVERSKRWTN